MTIIQKGTSVPALPLNNYPNQVTTLPDTTGIQVADDVTSIDFNIQRCTTATPTIWPNATTILQVKPEVSTDAGVSWVEAGAFTTNGGIIHDKHGNELARTRGGGFIPPAVGGIPRQYRVTITITGGPLRSTATIEVG